MFRAPFCTDMETIAIGSGLDNVQDTGRSLCNKGPQWTLWAQLDDLDFADNNPSISQTCQLMQPKISWLVVTSAKTVLTISKDKPKVMRVNNTSDDCTNLEGVGLGDMETITRLMDGGTDADI